MAPRRLATGGLGLLFLVLSVVAGELALRAFAPEAYRVFEPNLSRRVEPDPEAIHGIHGASRFTINEIGVRGDPLPDPAFYRMLAIGGSTTISGYLDDTETWVHRLQQTLDRASPDGVVWIGNAGKSGLSSVNHRLQVERLLPQHPEIDAVILLLGINDLGKRLRHPNAASYDRWLRAVSDERELERQTFHSYPGFDADSPWLARTGWGRLWRGIDWRALGSDDEALVQDRFGRVFEKWRRHRRSASAIREALPDLSSALSHYRANLERIARVSREAGVRVIFATQPVLWRPDLPAAERELLWMGGVGSFMHQPGSEYYSVEALAQGMARFNHALLQTCQATGSECVDLAGGIDADASVFFDDAHFTEEGARRVAALLAEYLLAREPFAR